MRRLLLLIALVVDLAGNHVVADAQTAAGSVTGRVLNHADGYALPGSVVTLTGVDGLERRIVTDEQGRFKIGEVPAGRYDLIAAMPGFAATMRNIEIGPPGSLELVLDVAMDYACAEEGIRVFLPLEHTLGQSDLVAHVRIVSEGALQSWPTRPACLHLAREYAASVQTVVNDDARQTPLSSLPILIGDPLRFSAGAELIVFLNWSPTARRFVLSGGDAAVGIRDGRLVSDHSTFAELSGLTPVEATQVIRHVVNLPALPMPPSVGFDDLTMREGRQLSGCSLAGQPWHGTQPAEIRQVFERLFPPSADDPAEPGVLPDWTAVTEAYAAKYQRVGGPDTEVLAVRFGHADQAEDRWPPRHLTSFGAIKVESIIAGVTGAPSPCLPVVATHLRSLVE